MKGNKKSVMNRVLSMILAVLMLVTSVPVDVHAAESSLKVANGQGEETDKIYVGEPIYVKAKSDIEGAWVGLYNKGDKEGAYWFYYYVSDSYDIYRNIYHSTAYSGYNQGTLLAAGEYDIVLYDADYGELLRKSIEIIEPESSQSALEVQATELSNVDNVVVKATSYNNQAWMAIYEGTKNPGENLSGQNYVSAWTYVAGINGAWYNFGPLSEGTYSVVMFTDGNYIVDKSVSITVSEAEVALITTDKTEYAFGEPIMVTSQYGNPYWVGLYKQSDANPTSAGPTSLFWLYATPGEAVNILSGEQQRQNDYVAGTYKVLLLDANYGIVGSVENITITAEETGRVTTPPTCEADGKIVVSYSDNTTKTITVEEDKTLGKLGHDYDADNDGKDDWVYSKPNKTHTKTCVNCNATDGCAECVAATVTDDCTWDEGVEIKPPTDTENGIKEYTCGVCGGKYTEPISMKTVVSEKVITPATCESEGTLRKYYNEDETEYIDVSIPKGSHDYDADDDGKDDWVHDKGKETHTKSCVYCTKDDGCAECNAALVTEKCNYTNSPVTDSSANKLTYTCEICNGKSSKDIITIEKTKYDYGEDINVVVNDDYVGRTEKDWIGLYLESDTPGTHDEQSFYWNYLNKLSLNGFNMIEPSNSALDDIKGSLYPYRADEYIGGKYIIYLFSNDGFDVIAKTEVFDIEAVKTEEKVTEATCEAEGETVIYFNDGTKDITKHDKLGHDYDADNDGKDDWVYNGEAAKTHTKTCQNEETKCNVNVRSVTENCTFGEPVISKKAEGTEAGEKTFTCSVCTGSYTEPYTDKEITGTEIIKKATCEENGTQRYYYEGGYFDVTIDMLGHKYGKEKHVEGTKTHSQTCEHDSDHVITDDCKYGTPVVDGKTVIYTCEECNGDYKTSVLTSDKVVYDVDDQILVTAFCENPGSWVGLYKKGEKYGEGAGTVFSMRWYYVKNDGTDRNGATIDISSSAYIGDRQDPIVAGDYYIVLFGDSGYNEITRIEISVVGDTSSTEYDIDINGTSYESGSKLEFLETDEIKVTISAEGSVGESWVGVYTNEMGIDTDFTDITSAYWQWIKDINGTTLDLKREMTLGYGDFSIVIFGDGGKSDPRKVVNFSIAQGENDSSIIKQPTCSNWGTRYVEYEDGTSAYVPIEPLGHDVKEWIFDKDRHSHSGICQRKNCGYEITRLCKFDDGVLIEQNPDGTGVILYTCCDCKGTYTEGYTEIPVDDTVVRIFGETRVETAMLVANRYKELLGVEKLDNIIIANGSNFADALAGSYLAKQKNAPILMYHGNNTDVLHKYINENLKSGGTVYILGGVNALPVEVETGLDGFYVKRLAGATRYETNIEILKEAGVTNQEILVCTGTGFADSLSASAVGKPILLVNSDTNELLDVQKEYLNSLSSDKYYIIGGENAVSENLEIAFRNYGATERLGGATRYETSVMVAERFFAMPDYVVLAYSMNFPDGLCGGSLAMAMNAPVILTATDNITEVKGYLENNKISAGTVLGGEGLISDEAVTEIFNMNEDNQIEVIK